MRLFDFPSPDILSRQKALFCHLANGESPIENRRFLRHCLVAVHLHDTSEFAAIAGCMCEDVFERIYCLIESCRRRIGSIFNDNVLHVFSRISVITILCFCYEIDYTYRIVCKLNRLSLYDERLRVVNVYFRKSLIAF